MKKSMLFLVYFFSASLYGGLDGLEEKKELVEGPPSGLDLAGDMTRQKKDTDKGETKALEELTFCGVCTALLCFLAGAVNNHR